MKRKRKLNVLCVFFFIKVKTKKSCIVWYSDEEGTLLADPELVSFFFFLAGSPVFSHLPKDLSVSGLSTLKCDII